MISYGPKTSSSTYAQRVALARASASPDPSPEDQALLRREDWDALIDYKLGILFPAERRELLLEALAASDRGRARLTVVYRGLKAIGMERAGMRMLHAWLPALVLAHAAEVLTPEEVHELLGLDG